MKLKPGAILEMPSDSGFAYAIYTHKHPEYLDLIRVFCGLRPQRVKALEELVDDDVCFSCFTPLQKVVKDGYGSIVGSVEVPEKLKAFPVFRAGMKNPATKKVDVWWLWDGTKEWRVGELDSEQMKFPILGVYGAEVILQYVREGWRPENSGW